MKKTILLSSLIFLITAGIVWAASAGYWSDARSFTGILPSTGNSIVTGGDCPNNPDTGDCDTYDSPANVAESYTDNGDGTVTDNVTGLMWCKDGSSACANNGTTANWYDASGTYDAAYNPDTSATCGDITYAGYSDWRLPTFRELMTILKTDASSAPYINTIFTNTVSLLYWSATTRPSNTAIALGAYFSNGVAGSNSKTNGTYVRCVR